MNGYGPLLAALVSLLAGLAIGKAWDPMAQQVASAADVAAVGADVVANVARTSLRKLRPNARQTLRRRPRSSIRTRSHSSTRPSSTIVVTMVTA